MLITKKNCFADIFKFDNSYSWYRSKRVFYKIEKIEPKDRPTSAASMRRKKMQQEAATANHSSPKKAIEAKGSDDDELDLK